MLRKAILVLIFAAIFSSNAFCDTSKKKSTGPSKQETLDYITEKLHGCINEFGEFPTSVSISNNMLEVNYNTTTETVPLSALKDETSIVETRGFDENRKYGDYKGFSIYVKLKDKVSVLTIGI